MTYKRSKAISKNTSESDIEKHGQRFSRGSWECQNSTVWFRVLSLRDRRFFRGRSISAVGQ